MSGSVSSLPLLTRLGNYELVRLLAQGGMADVYLARRAGIGQFERHVAIKVLNDQRSEDPEARALFLDEARLCGLFNHHNLASVIDVDVDHGVHYLTMEYVHGADLREVLAAAAKASKAIPFDAALSIVAAAAAGLDHAHRRCAPDGRPLHLVHRDVSLSNIMLGHDGGVKVVDFGIATTTVSSHFTNPGVVRGKASYMSPEQCLGDAVDLRTDVFALGVVLYELTTGRRCFGGTSDFERMLAVVQGEYVPPSIHVPEFPRALEAVINIALAQDPELRYASCAAMIEALERAAAAHNWTCGTSAIQRLMRDLFGDVTEPWSAPDIVDLTARRASAVPAPKTVVMTRPRRFAHGTESEPCVTAQLDEDDAPTRGRRSVPRLYIRTIVGVPPLAA